MKQPTQTRFINVDLDVRASSGVLDLVRALAPKAFALHSTDQIASFELMEIGPYSVEEYITGLVSVLEQMSPEARAIWDACELRDMNVGIQAGNADPDSTVFEVSPESVRRMAALGVRFLFTVYRPERESDVVIESEGVKAARKAGLIP